MKLVIDTNILFSFFINSSSFKKFITDNDLILYSPSKMLSELEKYSFRICELSGLTKDDFAKSIESLKDIIQLVEINIEEIENAEKYIDDKKDAPFLALAIKLQVPIWSEDKDFKRQNIVKSFNFEELKRFLNFNNE